MSNYPLHVFGGDEQAPKLLFAPGNGFPPPCYSPLLAPLTRDWRVLSLPPRALWPDIGPAPTEPGTWDGLVEDLLAGMAEHDLRDVVAVGHSFGALILMMAVLEQPKRFRGLAMLDPAILTHDRIDFVRAMRERGELHLLPIVAGTMRRRDRFPGLQETFDSWRSKPLFAEMNDELLWTYVRSTMQPAHDGDGVELVWPRDWEAWYYMSADMDVRDSLVWLNGISRTLVVQGTASDVFPADSLQRVRLHLPAGTFVTLADCGHMFPLSHPGDTRTALTDWLSSLP